MQLSPSSRLEDNCHFNSRGVRLTADVVAPLYWWNFNSRTRVECDLCLVLVFVVVDHFNSRTHVECDNFCLLTDTNGINFNSRGVRLRAIVVQGDTLSISTHALTWSATDASAEWALIALNFNSRTHVECDAKTKLYELAKINFNSRTHVECDNPFL